MKVNRSEIIKVAGYLGAGLVLAGIGRYLIHSIWSKWEISMVSVGAALLVLSIAFNYKEIAARFQTRSGKLGTNTLILSAAVIAIFAVANFLGFRHHKRIDLTTQKFYSLSDQTKKIVSGLNKDVKIIKFDQADNQGLKDQMSEYQYLSKRLTFEVVDPQTKPEIARQYQITKMGELVVASGERTERPDGSGEQDIVNAILKVTRDSLKTVCFVEGHGERATSSSDGEGLSSGEGLIKKENYNTKTVTLGTGTQVPADCSVLVVAGPKQPLLQPETAMIGKYLDAGGKAMLLIDPDTNPQLDEVLKAWKIDVGNNTVIDVSAAGQMMGGGPFAPLVLNYGSHPITKDFGRTMTIFPLARSVKPGDNSTSILLTSEASWGESELKAGAQPEFTEGKDVKGPVSLGVAASRTIGDKEARLVVIGDSDFVTNRVLGFQRNKDLFLNSINWLAQDEDLISIRPKGPMNRRVDLSGSQQNLLWLLIVVLIPLAVLGAGAYIWWKRR